MQSVWRAGTRFGIGNQGICSSKFGVTFLMYSKIEVNGPGGILYEAIIGADGPLLET